jgi:MFS family permease
MVTSSPPLRAEGAGATERSPKPGRLVLFFSASSLFWASMYVYVPILAVHSERNLGASMGLVGIIVGSYGFMQLVLRVPTGLWSDRIGRRKPFVLAGIVASVIGAVGMGLTSDPGWMVVWRGMSGVSAAAWVPFSVLFTSYFSPSMAARSLSYVTFAQSMATMTATFCGGAIAEHVGWHAPFFVAAALGVIGLLVALGLEEKPTPPRDGMSGTQFMRICTVPRLVAATSVAALSTLTLWATANGFTLVYAAQLGASGADLGALATAAQLASAVFALASAYVAERIGIRRTIVGAIIVQFVGAVMVPFFHSLPFLFASQVLVSGGRALLYPTTMSLSINAVPQEDKATAMGVFQAVYALGMFAGPASGGLIGDTMGISGVFYVAGAIALLGIPIVLARVLAE